MESKSLFFRAHMEPLEKEIPILENLSFSGSSH